MKKFLIVLWFVVIWLLGFWDKVNADCVKDISACIGMWSTNPGYSDCMQNANNVYNDCLQQEKDDSDKVANKKFCEENWGVFIDNGTVDWECSVTSCYWECDKYAEWDAKDICICRCNGDIVLNTEMPFGIWRCIKKGDSTGTVAKLSQAITRILMTLILVRWFGTLIYAWVLFASNNPTGAKKKIRSVIIAFAVIWSIWLVLRLINPNIFK